MMILPHHLCRTSILSTPYLEVSYVRCRPDCSLHQPHVQCVHVLYFIVNIFFVIGLGGGPRTPRSRGQMLLYDHLPRIGQTGAPDHAPRL